MMTIFLNRDGVINRSPREVNTFPRGETSVSSRHFWIANFLEQQSRLLSLRIKEMLLLGRWVSRTLKASICDKWQELLVNKAWHLVASSQRTWSCSLIAG